MSEFNYYMIKTEGYAIEKGRIYYETLDRTFYKFPVDDSGKGQSFSNPNKGWEDLTGTLFKTNDSFIEYLSHKRNAVKLNKEELETEIEECIKRSTSPDRFSKMIKD